MTRGGKRKGAGRPVASPKKQAKDFSLAGVRVTYDLLTCYKAAAAYNGLTLTGWVMMLLADGLREAADFIQAEKIDGAETSRNIAAMFREEADLSDPET